eukprot:m.174212 g.174212  ORF g.174212 m.174212 type:complete len:351 (+) comp18327_c0_seq1:1180-2232(+)
MFPDVETICMLVRACRVSDPQVMVIRNASSGFQQPPAAGIMGLGLSTQSCAVGTASQLDNSSAAQTCVEDAMTKFLRTNDMNNSFGLCLGTQNHPGLLTLGGADPAIVGTSAVQNVSLSSTPGNQEYFINTSALTVGSTTISVGPVQLDAGTYAVELNSSAYASLQTALPTCTSNSDCTVAVEFGAASLDIDVLLMCNATAGRCIISRGIGAESCTFSGVSAVCQSTCKPCADCTESDPSQCMDADGNRCSNSTCALQPCRNKLPCIAPAIKQSSTGRNTLGYTFLQQYYSVFDRASSTVAFSAAPASGCQPMCSSFVTASGEILACPMAGVGIWAIMHTAARNMSPVGC